MTYVDIACGIDKSVQMAIEGPDPKPEWYDDPIGDEVPTLDEDDWEYDYEDYTPEHDPFYEIEW